MIGDAALLQYKGFRNDDLVGLSARPVPVAEPLGYYPGSVHLISCYASELRMVIHSDSFVGVMLPFVVALAVVVLVLTSAGMLAFGNFRRMARTLRALVGLVGVYVVVLIAVSLLTPQKIGNAGQAYCMDIWCIGIEKVSPMPARNEIAYKVDVRIFSDASTVKTSGKGFSLFLVDERGRRFPMVKDPSVIPFDLSLDPGQSVNTSLTFVTPADARELFLTVDSPLFWGARLCFACDGSLLHKPTLLRVL